MINLERDTGEYLSWELSPISSWGAFISEENPTANHVIYNYVNISISIETSDIGIKEIYTLKNQTMLVNNRLRITIDSNEQPRPRESVYLDYAPHDDDNPSLDCVKVTFGGCWIFDYLEISDSNGLTTRGWYDIRADGDIDIVLPQNFLDAAVGDIVIDPNVQVLGSELDIADYEGNSKQTNNSKDYCIAGRIGATGYILISDTPTTPSWANEYSSSPFTTSTELDFMSVICLLDESFLFVSYDGTKLVCCKRTKAGVWDGSLTTIVTYTKPSQPMFEAKVYGDGDSIAIIYWTGTVWKLIISTDGGATWTAKSDAISKNYVNRAFSLVASTVNSDKLYFFLHNGSSGQYILYKEYTISTDTWGASQYSAGYQQHAPQTAPLCCVMDADGFFHMSSQRKNTGVDHYWSNYSGAWVDYSNPGNNFNYLSFIDSNGDFGSVCVYDAAAPAGVVAWWDRSTSAWLANETPGAGFTLNVHGSKIVGFGQNVWWSEQETGVGTNYVYLTDKVFYGESGDTDPPTGGWASHIMRVGIREPLRGGMR